MNLNTFNSLSYEEQKQTLLKYMIAVDPQKTERSCGDGRKALNADLFIKNFGGSLGAATVAFINEWREGKTPSYGEVVDKTLTKLSPKFDLGGHRDDHNNNDPISSGCGYADNRQAIVTRIAKTEDFASIINSVFTNAIHEKNRELWDSILATYQKIEGEQAKITPTGEQLISSLEAKDSSILVLEGSHQEYAIVFNQKHDYTLDTNKLVEDGGSAFCVDIWDAMAQTNFLEIPKEEAKLTYYAEWVATALVLVVDKGNPLPPIFLFSE